MSEIVKQEIEQVVYKPKLEQKKAVSFIWVLPLIILCVLGWIAYESYMQKGTNITVTFKSAEGLKEGVTPLEYKGLQLGKVTEISMHDDLKSVKVNILVKKEVAKVENVLKQTSLYVQVNHLDGDDFNKDTVDHMVDALADDLNTSLALTEILNQVKVLNQAMRVKEKDNTLILKEYNTLLKMTDVVGFVFKPKQLDEDELELYSKWLDAKAVKDFEKADQYRAELIQKGII